jgi:hypothetical protein
MSIKLKNDDVVATVLFAAICMIYFYEENFKGFL